MAGEVDKVSKHEEGDLTRGGACHALSETEKVKSYSATGSARLGPMQQSVACHHPQICW